jgi:hypothetical protein
MNFGFWILDFRLGGTLNKHLTPAPNKLITNPKSLHRKSKIGSVPETVLLAQQALITGRSRSVCFAHG